jgi:hypothetical protein
MLALFAVLILAGCAGPERTGATLDALNKRVGLPRPGQARVVVLRSKEFHFFDVGWKVFLDQVAMGDLKTGTFVYGDVPAGQHQLLFSRPGDFSRASHQEFATASGRTYYFRLVMNQKGAMVSASQVSAGLVGLMVSSAVSSAVDDRGFFDFVALDDAAARAAMAESRLSE